jgi:hypothetical protein
VVGRHGEITYTRREPGRWTASAHVRDRDGSRRRVRATGANKTRARLALEDKLEGRPSFGDGGIGAATTVAQVAELWLDGRAASAALAAQALDRHRTLVENHIKPGIGNLRVGEATVGRIDQFLRRTAKKVPTQARHCRTILNGALAMAARHDAIAVNPVRETATTSGTLVYVKGEGLIRQDHPKTDAGWRTVVLPAFAVQTLRRTRAAQAANDADVVFPAAAGTLRSPANFRRKWRAARRDTGFEWVTPRSFRKTVATLLDRERTTADAAAQLGYSSPNVTRTHYIQKAHQAPDLTDVLDQLGTSPQR